jgi:hypothetical protein
MCQDKIIRYLEKQKGRQFTIVDLMTVIPANRGNISRACRTMVEHNEVRCERIREGPFTRQLFSAKPLYLKRK